ncbi:carbon-nitrogen hydrolase family protein [Selenomonas noxia]
MQDLKENCRLALVQAAPVMFDKAASLKKALLWIEKSAAQGAELVVFPELFLPGYPFGMTFGFKVGSRDENGRKDWKLYYDNSVVCPGPETDALGAAAKKHGIYLSIGVSERDDTTGTLYNTNIMFTPDGALASVHRKLKPTGAERFVWGDANRGYFPTIDSPWGPLGSLICWENYMPLARAALYQRGVNIFIAPNTNDVDSWINTARHIGLEGRCYFINADMYFTRADYPRDQLHCDEEIDRLPEIVCRGGSCIVDPFGEFLTEPVWDREELIVADLDLGKAAAAKMEFDPCGHYARPDVLELNICDK